MSNIDNLIIEHLKAIRATVDRLEREVKEVKGRLIKEVKGRLINVESALMSNRRDVVLQDENIYRQQVSIDRITERLDRIEKRLELSD